MSEQRPVTVEQIEAFRAAAQEKIQGIHNQMFPEASSNPVLELMDGRRNVRVVRQDGPSRSVFCFVEKATGNILKAASWAAPAKHARGNINTPTSGVEFVGLYGPAYLR